MQERTSTSILTENIALGKQALMEEVLNTEYMFCYRPSTRRKKCLEADQHGSNKVLEACIDDALAHSFTLWSSRRLRNAAKDIYLFLKTSIEDTLWWYQDKEKVLDEIRKDTEWVGKLKMALVQHINRELETFDYRSYTKILWSNDYDDDANDADDDGCD